MLHRWFAPAQAAAMAALLVTAAMPLAAQSAKTASKPYTPKRLADGHPDLQGVYDLATLTPMERPAGLDLVLTNEQAAQMERAVAMRRKQGDAALKGDRGAPPKGGDGSVGAAGNVGGYNSGWLDPGSTYTIVDGQKRSSILVDPPNGRVPPMTPSAIQRATANRSRPTSDAQESNDPGLEKAPGAYDDPERRSEER